MNEQANARTNLIREDVSLKRIAPQNSCAFFTTKKTTASSTFYSKKLLISLSEFASKIIPSFFCSAVNIGFQAHQNTAQSSTSKIPPRWLSKLEPKIKKGWSSLTEQFSGAWHLCSEEMQQAQFLGSTLTM